MKCHIVIETASTPSDSQDTFVFAAQRLRMPKAVWYSLSASDQQTWDTFSDETKRKILHAFANGEMSSAGIATVMALTHTLLQTGRRQQAETTTAMVQTLIPNPALILHEKHFSRILSFT